MELTGPNKTLGVPFNFNLGSLKDVEYIKIFNETWRSMERSGSRYFSLSFMTNMN